MCVCVKKSTVAGKNFVWRKRGFVFSEESMNPHFVFPPHSQSCDSFDEKTPATPASPWVAGPPAVSHLHLHDRGLPCTPGDHVPLFVRYRYKQEQKHPGGLDDTVFAPLPKKGAS